MHPALQEFLSNNGQAVVAAITVITCVGLVQWFKLRRAELLGAWTLDDTALESIARVVKQSLAVPAAPRKGLIEQLSQLSLPVQVLAAIVSPIAAAATLIVIVCVTACRAPFHSTHQMVVQRQVVDNATYNSVSPPKKSELTLVPEKPYVLLAPGDSGVCRVHLVDGYVVFDLTATAIVTAQSNPNAALGVEIAPCLLVAKGGPASRHCDIRFRSIRGYGDFTVQVSAADQYSQRATTSFVVRVEALAPTAAPPTTDP